MNRSSTPPQACVVGHPIAHSKSPIIHGFWLRQLGLPGIYTKRDVEPGQFQSFIRQISPSGLSGCNVTLPHKEAAFAAVEQCTPTAVKIGAVNTIWLETSGLVGDNTDAYGFLANLDHQAPNWDRTPGPAVIIGAGGAARAVVTALMERQMAPIHIVNRTLERADNLAREFGPDCAPCDLAKAPRILPGARLLVNTSTLGMTGQPELQLSLEELPESCVVCDIVYTPLETSLLRAARNRGLAAVDGLGMLLHQAVPGFERWFGARPHVSDELRRTVLRSMGQLT